MAGGADSGGSSHRGRLGSGRKTSRFKKMNAVSSGLMLASMLDILMAILFFLLKNYSTAVTDFNLGRDIALPNSSAIMPPMPALQLVVTQKAIMLDEKEVATIVNGDISRKDLYKDGVSIIPLMQALKAQKDRSLYIQNNSDTHSFTGTIVLQADKNLQFNVLKKIIYTAGISDFVMLKLAVLKKDEG